MFTLQALYGVACPAAVGMATSGVGTAVGATACSIGVSTCKRNVRTWHPGTDLQGVAGFSQALV